MSRLTKSSPAAIEHSGIAVRCSELFDSIKVLIDYEIVPRKSSHENKDQSSVDQWCLPDYGGLKHFSDVLIHLISE